MVFSVAITGCSDEADAPPATASTTAAAEESPTPRPVFLQPIEGADLEKGTEGGADFAIEVPDDWNGDLVLFLHGAQATEPPVVSPPFSREHLIANGYAWGASAFRESGFVPEIAVADTNALYARFVRDHGEPRHTYLYGASMGGAAAMIASEQEGAPYDGVLAVCASAGEQTWLALHADYLTIGAYAVGVAPRTYGSDEIGALVDEVVAGLEDPSARTTFETLMVDWTGGERPLALEGLREEGEPWEAIRLLADNDAIDNRGRDYASVGIEQGQAIELNNGAAAIVIGAGDVTGQFRVPVLTMHDTGDAVVPLTDAVAIRQRAIAASQSGRLVQRTVQSPIHCDFTDDELERGFGDLVDWVEDGFVPEGEDLLSFDPITLGAAFTTRER